MERNDLWLTVKGNYIFFTGKIILNLDLLGLLCYKLITIVNCYLETGLTCIVC